MKPVQRNELLDLGAYEEIRERFRVRMIQEKRARRVALGEHMSVLFENHDTVLFQIQEMLRTERITRERAIAHELETYNELVPGADELSLTIFVEYPDAAERERMLVALAGLENRFRIRVNDHEIAIRNETRGTRTDRTTAVHYAKAPLGAEAAAAIREGRARVTLIVDHPAYRAEADLGEETLAALAEDLV